MFLFVCLFAVHLDVVRPSSFIYLLFDCVVGCCLLFACVVGCCFYCFTRLLFVVVLLVVVCWFVYLFVVCLLVAVG